MATVTLYLTRELSPKDALDAIQDALYDCDLTTPEPEGAKFRVTIHVEPIEQRKALKERAA